MTAEKILVLGARVIDGRPEPILRHRLRRALTLVEEMDRAGHRPTVVVSGQGEAEAMFEWLVHHGLDAERLLIEPDATSTNENLEKAHALVPGAGRWLVVTSDFHAWRTRLWAWHLAIPVTVVTAHTPLKEGLGHWGRELVATSHSLLRVGWRKIRGGR